MHVAHRRALALCSAALLGAAAFWASLSRIRSFLTGGTGTLYRDDDLPPWHEGLLDIHHLQVGSSQSTFVVMPDGSTLLIDAGDLDAEAWARPDAARAPIPNSTRTPAGWAVEYLRRFWPRSLELRPALDFVLVTHFHKDHIGDIEAAVRRGAVKLHEHDRLPLTGLSQVAEAFRFDRLIDRAYPDYDLPVNLFNTPDGAFYMGFVESLKVDGTTVERFQVASSSQLRMVQPGRRLWSCVIKNIKANTEVARVDAEGNLTGKLVIPGTIFTREGAWDENLLSAAIVMEYGGFRYYEGGDTEVGPGMDAVNPTARAVGKVDVATLNHHGLGVTRTFAQAVDPKVAILQVWRSDQPPSESLRILAEEGMGMERDIFATDLFPERMTELGSLGLASNLRSSAGHVVVRVYPERGNKQAYEVFVLDPSSLSVSQRHGPYEVRK